MHLLIGRPLQEALHDWAIGFALGQGRGRVLSINCAIDDEKPTSRYLSVPESRLSGLIVACFGRLWVLQTTSEVFARISPDNSLERLTECGVGLVTDQSSDFWELFVTPFE